MDDETRDAIDALRAEMYERTMALSARISELETAHAAEDAEANTEDAPVE